MTSSAETPSVSGFAGQTSNSQPAIAAHMKTGLAKAASSESARGMVFVHIGTTAPGLT